MGAKEIEAKTTELVLNLLKKAEFAEFELVDVEYVKEGSTYYLRVFIDKPGGVNINDCVALTEPMNEALDANPFINEAYIFEVSSPGLDRPIKKDKDFERNLGKEIEIRLFAQVNGEKDFEGTLTDYDADTFTIENNGEKTVFERKKAALVRQLIKF